MMQQLKQYDDDGITQERGRGKRILALDGLLKQGFQPRPLHADATHEQRMLRKWMVPFIEGLSQEHQDLINAAFYERASEYEIGSRIGVTVDPRNGSPAAHRRLETALKALTRAIALTDPEFAKAEAAKPKRPGRPARDYDAERAAAYRAYLRAMDYED